MMPQFSVVWKTSVLAMLLLSSGCGLLHPRLDNGKRLIEHPEFAAAAQAAPNWTQEALDIIAALESEIEKQ